ncbi:MAG: hypothetical protein IPJ88_01575 [Myxococcales bacterium]|nr:MAG: hypothetical protein IPJ88_01575 [Myxococcales bacterium]
MFFDVNILVLAAQDESFILPVALRKHRRGAFSLESAIEGAKARLMPILITSFAFIAGLMPLAVGRFAEGKTLIQDEHDTALTEGTDYE